MGKSWLVMAALAGLAACGTGEHQPAAAATAASPATTPPPRAAPAVRPDLSRCEKFKPDSGEDLRQRDKPLNFPPSMAALVATDRDHIAVATLGGTTLCLDARWQDSIEDPVLSKDGRFLAWSWSGYESYGYELIDRSGTGQEIDTGDKPVPSPSGKRLASVEWSESAFGSLNGVLVLQILPQGLKELARIEALPDQLADWRIERWRGESCFELSAVRWDDFSGDGGAAANTPRQRFAAIERKGRWAIVKAEQGCPTP